MADEFDGLDEATLRQKLEDATDYDERSKLRKAIRRLKGDANAKTRKGPTEYRRPGFQAPKSMTIPNSVTGNVLPDRVHMEKLTKTEKPPASAPTISYLNATTSKPAHRVVTTKSTSGGPRSPRTSTSGSPRASTSASPRGSTSASPRGSTSSYHSVTPEPVKDHSPKHSPKRVGRNEEARVNGLAEPAPKEPTPEPEPPREPTPEPPREPTPEPPREPTPEPPREPTPEPPREPTPEPPREPTPEPPREPTPEPPREPTPEPPREPTPEPEPEPSPEPEPREPTPPPKRNTPQLPNMEFGRRLAMERELEKMPAFSLANALFDESGNFLLYATMMGVKVINLYTNKCVRVIGKEENVRLLQLALHQGQIGKKAAVSMEMEVSDNPTLRKDTSDPTLICTAYKKNRFYMFSRREPEDTKGGENDRDVFNEKPSKEEQMGATQSSGSSRVSNSATLHTTLGDIQLKLFPEYCPKTVENFCVHASKGYYNGHIFHRVIKQFMIQTGDPTGTGTGGESIWGGEFEDEFHPKLRHDRPYTLSMANAGPNTNGSQFFVTVVPTPWLDSKHTVFGRVTRGMEVCQKISEAKVHPKTDKPYEDIKIMNVTLK